MKNAAQTRVLAVLLALATIGVCVLAAMNFDHESGLGVPTDGIWWVEAKGGLRAERVPVDSPGIAREYERATFWSVLTTSQRLESHRSGREMYRTGIWGHATYSILRPVPQSTDLNGAPRLDIQVFLGRKTVRSTRACDLLRWSICRSESTCCSGAGPRPNPSIFTSSAWRRLCCTASARPESWASMTGAIWWRRHCSRRSSCTSLSASRITSPRRTVTGSGERSCMCCFTCRESFCWGCNIRRYDTGRRRRCCCTGWTRSRLVIWRFTTSSPLSSSATVTVMRSRHWNGSNLSG